MVKQKEKWYFVSKKGKNFENLFLSLVARGLAPAEKSALTATQVYLPAYLQASGNRYFSYQECQKHINKLEKFLKNQPALLVKEYKVYQKLLRQMTAFAKTMPQCSFKLNWPALLNRFSVYVRLAIRYGYNYYFLNQPVADIILRSLEKAGSKNIFSDFEILSQASQLSVVQQEKLSLLKIVRLIKTKRLPLSNPTVQQAVKNHWSKYSYMGFYYMRGRSWQSREIILRIKELLSGDWLREEKRLQELSRADRLSQGLMKRHRFNAYQKKVVALMKEMAYATNLYDETHNFYFYQSRPLMAYLSKKVGVTYNQLIEMDFAELIDLLNQGKKASLALIKILIAREKDSVLVCRHGQVEILTGKTAKKYVQQYFPESKLSFTKELKGQCACQGQAIGQVVIFRSVADIPKIKKGNIMVAKATVPSFVPAMEKAAGIVTEMGGLLSHAAIVSRELGVPCVVGVENITKILKDGEMVEVDATKGIVKKNS